MGIKRKGSIDNSAFYTIKLVPTFMSFHNKDMKMDTF